MINNTVQKPALPSYLQPKSNNPIQSALSNKIGGTANFQSIAANGPSASTLGIQSPVKKVENKNTGVTTHYDVPKTPTPQIQTNAGSSGLVNPNSNMNDVTPGPEGKPVTYPGLVNTLANQQNTPNNQVATQSAQSLQSLAGNNPATSGPALEGYNKAVKDLADFDKQLAQKYGDMESSRIPLQFVQGREQVLAKQAASQRDALQQAVNQQQAAIGYGISGQQTQNSGYSAAGSLANSTQGLQQSALGTAAGLAAPRQQGYTLIDPQTGQLQGGGNAINQGAQYDAQYQGALGNAQDNQAIAGAQNNIDSITQLINSAGLNNSKINLQNATIQALQANMSNSDYQTLNNSLQAINAALSKVTGTPIDIAQLSSSQGTSLIATINNAVATAKGIAAGKISGGQNNSNTNATTSSSSSGPLTWDSI